MYACSKHKFLLVAVIQISLSLSLSLVLFKSFLKVESIKQHFKGTLVGMVLNGYLSLKR